jgi:hypothetical protein
VDVREAIVWSSTGLVVAFVATRAAIHNLQLWQEAKKKRGPLIIEDEMVPLEPDWPVKGARARQWPSPTQEALTLRQPAYWAAYARLAKEEAQRKRLFAEGGFVVAGSWLGVRLEPLVRYFVDTAKRTSPPQDTSPLPGGTWQEGLLNLSPFLLLVFFVFLLKWADMLGAMGDAYAQAATRGQPATGDKGLGVAPIDGVTVNHPPKDHHSCPRLAVLGSVSLGVALILARSLRRIRWGGRL